MNHPTRTILRAGAIAASAAVCATLAIAGPAQAAIVTDTSTLREAVTLDGVMGHLQASRPSPTRTTTTVPPGRRDTRAPSAYVQEQLEAAGYTTVVPGFHVRAHQLHRTSLSRTSPDPDVRTRSASTTSRWTSPGGGDVTAPVTAVDVNLVGDHASTSGCEAADFAGFPAGNIALIQRGSATSR